jgi:hypothetical protein
MGKKSQKSSIRLSRDGDANYARRMIAAADVCDQVCKTVPTGTVPTTESQARPLTKLPPEEQAPAWQEAQAVAAQLISWRHG